MEIKESGEMYLEVMYRLLQKKGEIRSVDIAESLGYSKPSVSRAIKILREEGYVKQEPYGKITFTKKGAERAFQVLERHHLLTEFLVITLNIAPEKAEQDACRIEHFVSDDTIAAVRKFLENKIS